tara:strand:+ start:281 stop:415 length:135 start_codon:yes stop_codon:yes gene_type:complete
MIQKNDPKSDIFDPSEEYFKKNNYSYEDDSEEYFPLETSKPPHY